MTKHNPHQRDRIVDFIDKFADTFGHPPTVRQIQSWTGLASPSAVHYHLGRLVKEGTLRQCPCGCHAYVVTA